MRLTKSNLIAFSEYAFFVIAMLLISDALTPILYPQSREALDLGDSNPNRLILATAIYCIALLLLVPRIRQALALLRRRPELIILLALPIISATWSPDPGPVAKRALAHLLTITFCLYVATRYSPDEFFERLLVAFWMGIVASIIVAIILPDIGVSHDQANAGAWKGVYGHKAIAGRMCAITIFLSFLYTPRNNMLHFIRLTAIALSICLCIMTQSRASWLLVIFGAGGMLIVQCLRFGRLSAGIRVFIASAIIISMVIVGTASFNDLLQSMGRDATLSGRTKLWDAAIVVASDNHPWWGSGYRDFWLGPAAEQVGRYISTWAKVPGHGHNGYLDTWLELGWVGLAILAFFIVRTLISVFAASIKQPSSNIWAVFAVCCLIFMVNNISATVALRHTDITWVLVILASLYTAGIQRNRKPGREQGAMTNQTHRVTAMAFSSAEK